MMDEINIWQFAAGLGLFLYGMVHLEQGVKELAGRRFKVFIKKHTKNRIKAILGGTAITAVLQSSSVVSLMLLAFVGAGVISMQNALGVILGSNLGTTFTGWLVATLGFKVNIEHFVMPFIAIGGLVIVLFPRQIKLFNGGMVVIGLAFLFLGLSFMKESIMYLAENFDVGTFADHGPIVFLIVGFVFTALIQSSSASMVITLSALHAGIIDFSSGAAMVIGSDLGTTITVLLGGLTGTAAKKRVALGHFLFNLITDILAFAFMGLLITLITKGFGITDELIGLVVFHSTFNIIGILVFFPFIGVFAKFLTGRYRKKDEGAAIFINESTVEIPETALQALHNETRHLISLTINLCYTAFHQENIQGDFLAKETGQRGVGFLTPKISLKDFYHKIKRLKGEMINFYGELQKQTLSESESVRLSMLIISTGDALHAAKGIKDIEADLLDFRRSSRSTLNRLYKYFSDRNEEVIGRFLDILKSGNDQTYFEELGQMMIIIQKNFDSLLNMVYERSNRRHLKEEEIATVLNVNRELYSSYKAILLALKDYLLNPEQAGEFENLPAFR